MNPRLMVVVSVIASFVLLTLGACNSSGLATPEPSSASPPTRAEVLPPTPLRCPLQFRPSPQLPIRSPFEEGFLLIENVEDPASIREMSLKGHAFVLERGTPARNGARPDDRESLAQDSGMLFVFSAESPLNF